MSSRPVNWVHCNQCFDYFGAEKKFYLMNCMHVACRPCVAKGGNPPKCTLCKKKIALKEINGALPEKYQQMFYPKLAFSLQSSEFQTNHMFGLTKKLKAENILLGKLNEENKKLQESQKELLLEEDRLAKYRRQLQANLIMASKTSTPSGTQQRGTIPGKTTPAGTSQFLNKSATFNSSGSSRMLSSNVLNFFKEKSSRKPSSRKYGESKMQQYFRNFK